MDKTLTSDLPANSGRSSWLILSQTQSSTTGHAKAPRGFTIHLLHKTGFLKTRGKKLLSWCKMPVHRAQSSQTLRVTFMNFQISASLRGLHEETLSQLRVLWETMRTYCFFLHSDAFSTVKSDSLTNPSAFSAWNTCIPHIWINALGLTVSLLRLYTLNKTA